MNPHPPLAMFPAAIAAVFFCLEILQLLGVKGLVSAKLRIVLATILALSLLFAYYSGFYGLDYATKTPSEPLKLHQAVARFTALLSLPLLLFSTVAYQKPPKSPIFIIFLVTLALLFLGLLYTSHLGGKLVFEYGAGVTGIGH